MIVDQEDSRGLFLKRHFNNLSWMYARAINRATEHLQVPQDPVSAVQEDYAKVFAVPIAQRNSQIFAHGSWTLQRCSAPDTMPQVPLRRSQNGRPLRWYEFTLRIADIEFLVHGSNSLDSGAGLPAPSPAGRSAGVKGLPIGRAILAPLTPRPTCYAERKQQTRPLMVTVSCTGPGTQ